MPDKLKSSQILGDDLRIRVAQSDIADLHGRRLPFAPQATFRPDPNHLAWHRREVFGCS